MATIHRPIVSTAPSARPSAPFDNRLSLALDALQIQLDANPRGFRRLRLRLLKRYWERKIPAPPPAARTSVVEAELPAAEVAA